MKIKHFLSLIAINSVSSSAIPADLSNLLQSRIKRDDHYNMKCHQSHTGKRKINTGA
jgi:hypothetical protein